MKSNFKWDAEALDRDTLTINLNGEDVTFTELPRKDALAFITESQKIPMTKPVLGPDDQPLLDDKGDPVQEMLPLVNRYGDHADLIFKTLAQMTGGSKKEKYFADLDMGLEGITQFADLILTLNHVEDILGSAGNLFLLPWAKKKNPSS